MNLINIWINACTFNVYYTHALLVWINYYLIVLLALFRFAALLSEQNFGSILSIQSWHLIWHYLYYFYS